MIICFVLNTRNDPVGNTKPYKEKSKERTDDAFATIMAPDRPIWHGECINKRRKTNAIKSVQFSDSR